MTDAIEKIMSFINENTTILIIICVFLIVVLVAYLIENAIKVDKVNKNVKKEQEEINKKVAENNIEDKKEEIDSNKFEPVKVPESPKVDNIFNETQVDKMPEEEIVGINDLISSTSDIAEDESIQEIIDDEVPEKEDNSVDVIYKNDKKLSEILFDTIESQPSGKLDSSIVKKDEIEKEKNLKDLEDSANELDRIMQKLNSYNSSKDINEDDENFSNIF